jgi:hypothetical protein
MKLLLKGRRFDMTEDIHEEPQEFINTTTFENFQGCMKSWETCWDHCIHAQRDYFEGDSENYELWLETSFYGKIPTSFG